MVSSYQSLMKCVYAALLAFLFIFFGYFLGLRSLVSFPSLLDYYQTVHRISTLEVQLLTLESRFGLLRDGFAANSVGFSPVPFILKEKGGVLSHARGGPGVFLAHAGTHYIEKALDGLAVAVHHDETFLSIAESVLVSQRVLYFLLPSGLPVKEFRITSGYGPRIDPFTHQLSFHAGYDFAAPLGTPVLSVAPGVVKRVVFKSKGYGNFLEVDHGYGLSTRYAHLGQINARVGDLVKKGTVLAKIGVSGQTTGPHLHFEVLKYGVPQDPGVFFMQKQRSVVS